MYNSFVSTSNVFACVSFMSRKIFLLMNFSVAHTLTTSFLIYVPVKFCLFGKVQKPSTTVIRESIRQVRNIVFAMFWCYFLFHYNFFSSIHREINATRITVVKFFVIDCNEKSSPCLHSKVESTMFLFSRQHKITRSK